MSFRVLVAEQEGPVLDMMREVMPAHGVSDMRVVDHQAVAENLMNQVKFEAVFTDMWTPNLDGIQLIRKFRRSSWNPKVPIIVIATAGDPEARSKAFDAGATFYMERPVERKDFARLLRSARSILADEKRRTIRLPINTSVACLAESREFVGTMHNLSRDGMMLQSDGTVRRGLILSLTFCLEMRKPPVKIQGIVARVDAEKRFGVRFVPSSSDDLQRIRDFIAKSIDLS